MTDPVNQNTGQTKRTTSEAVDSSTWHPGPFVAIVKNHLDSTYGGRLEVLLQKKAASGNSPATPGKTVPASYLSPFYGITPYDGLTANEGHQFSQKSYGFWAVPPDIGTKVLVICAEGGQYFWIGCIQEEYTNFMLPGVTPATTYNDQDPQKKLPVGEYNKKTETAAGRDATQYTKPVNTDALSYLEEQGLIDDSYRGITTSSARREVPSNVVGLSSPGPQDRREGAPKARYGEQFAQSTTAHNRLGGSSLVFDDGDPSLLRKGPPGGPDATPPEYANAEGGDSDGDVTRPHNELVRLRTRTGHQILMHNTEDFIYIGNSRGTAWIELTSNGKIDIYAADDVSINTEGNMNFKASGSMYFEAGADIHMKAGANIFQTAAANIELKAGADGKITTGGLADVKSGGDTRITGANTHFSAGSHTFTGQINQNGPTAAQAGEAAEAEPSQRVPAHEPWDGHENLNGVSLTDPSLAVPDTFRKNRQREIPRPEEEDTSADNGVIQSPNR